MRLPSAGLLWLGRSCSYEFYLSPGHALSKRHPAKRSPSAPERSTKNYNTITWRRAQRALGQVARGARMPRHHYTLPLTK